MRTAPSEPHGDGPRFSIVTAVYNVERYLPAFIASLAAQDFPADRFEVIAVDDGSTDGSLALLRAWAETAAFSVQVVTKENGGQSTARNLGLDHARGEWVTFPDPDDVLVPGYLSAVDTFLGSRTETVLVACNLLLLADLTGQVEDKHPLRQRFRGPARLRDLDRQPAYFFASAPAAFFRRAEVERLQLRFDPAIRPNFEDGEFTVKYLLSFARPLVGFVPAAQYHYRKRADLSSTLNRSVADPNRYTTVLRLGYINLLQHARTVRDGQVPEWLQNLILYELSWLLTTQVQAGATASSAVRDVADEFHALMTELLALLDPLVIEGSPVTRLGRFWRQVLMHAWSPEDWHQASAQLTTYDSAQRLVRVTYRFVGARPAEVCLSDGEVIVPTHAKVRDLTVLGRAVMSERILWLPAGRSVRIQLNGRSLPLELEPPRRTTHVIAPAVIKRNLDRRGLRSDREQPRRTTQPEPGPFAKALVRLARTRPVRRTFGRAWVLMDRVHDATDNGQRLFEHLRAERPEINAWFTIRRDSAEWRSLRAAHGRRVVAYGSLRWKLLLLNAEHLLSSHADQPVVAPREITVDLGVTPTWRFTFLQHGVIKDDLANWLNPKRIDVFVTSTPAEHASIVGDHTSYVYTTRETKMAGLPRFDRLRELGSRYGVDQRDLILIAPTWRNWLTVPTVAGSQERTVYDDFHDSEFAQQWLEVLASPRLEEVARRTGRTVAFLPHPNMQGAMKAMDLPDHVLALTFTENDVQEVFARAAVLVTDYSSMAFNAAYLDRPVVYFQFDRDRVLSGEHIGTQGYFDYHRDGFGPIESDATRALDAVVAAAEAGQPTPEFQARIDATFPQRDGRCCERVVEAVLASTTKAT